MKFKIFDTKENKYVTEFNYEELGIDLNGNVIYVQQGGFDEGQFERSPNDVNRFKVELGD